MARHHQFMMGGVPEAYRLLTNPLPENAEVISRGRAIYRDHCASCHGPSGLGDGEDGRTIAETRQLGVALTYADDDARHP
jgi:mono/diheme cytochrome c family protein